MFLSPTPPRKKQPLALFSRARTHPHQVCRSGRKKSTGFTLIEILVTIGIFTLVTTAVMVSYSSTDGNSILEQAQSRLTLTLKEARSMSSYGEELKNTGDFPSYGVVVNKGEEFIQIYTDCTEDSQFLPTPADCPGPASAVFIKKYDLKGAKIENIYLDADTTDASPGSSVDTVYIEYIVASQSIRITDGAGSIFSQGQVSLLLGTGRAPDLSRSVTVQTTGLIESN